MNTNSFIVFLFFCLCFNAYLYGIDVVVSDSVPNLKQLAFNKVIPPEFRTRKWNLHTEGKYKELVYWQKINSGTSLADVISQCDPKNKLNLCPQTIVEHVFSEGVKQFVHNVGAFQALVDVDFFRNLDTVGEINTLKNENGENVSFEKVRVNINKKLMETISQTIEKIQSQMDGKMQRFKCEKDNESFEYSLDIFLKKTLLLDIILKEFILAKKNRLVQGSYLDRLQWELLYILCIYLVCRGCSFLSYIYDLCCDENQHKFWAEVIIKLSDPAQFLLMAHFPHRFQNTVRYFYQGESHASIQSVCQEISCLCIEYNHQMFYKLYVDTYFSIGGYEYPIYIWNDSEKRVVLDENLLRPRKRLLDKLLMYMKDSQIEVRKIGRYEEGLQQKTMEYSYVFYQRLLRNLCKKVTDIFQKDKESSELDKTALIDRIFEEKRLTKTNIGKLLVALGSEDIKRLHAELLEKVIDKSKIDPLYFPAFTNGSWRKIILALVNKGLQSEKDSDQKIIKSLLFEVWMLSQMGSINSDIVELQDQVRGQYGGSLFEYLKTRYDQYLKPGDCAMPYERLMDDLINKRDYVGDLVSPIRCANYRDFLIGKLIKDLRINFEQLYQESLSEYQKQLGMSGADKALWECIEEIQSSMEHFCLEHTIYEENVGEFKKRLAAFYTSEKEIRYHFFNEKTHLLMSISDEPEKIEASLETWGKEFMEKINAGKLRTSQDLQKALQNIQLLNQIYEHVFPLHEENLYLDKTLLCRALDGDDFGQENEEWQILRELIKVPQIEFGHFYNFLSGIVIVESEIQECQSFTAKDERRWETLTRKYKEKSQEIALSGGVKPFQSSLSLQEKHKIIVDGIESGQKSSYFEEKQLVVKLFDFAVEFCNCKLFKFSTGYCYHHHGDIGKNSNKYIQSFILKGFYHYWKPYFLAEAQGSISTLCRTFIDVLVSMEEEGAADEDDWSIYKQFKSFRYFIWEMNKHDNEIKYRLIFHFNIIKALLNYYGRKKADSSQQKDLMITFEIRTLSDCLKLVELVQDKYVDIVFG